MRESYKVLGLMSGTSLDGVDLACCSFYFEDGEWGFELNEVGTVPYSDSWKNRLLESRALSPVEIERLNVEYGHYLGDIVSAFINENNLKIEFIASHGHTVFHQPEIGYTLQIGNGPEIYEKVRIPVVCDFRIQDVELGGQGAPLVPIGDKLLFSKYNACVNIGGFSNISFDLNGERVAFDIGPANIVLNHLVKPMGLEYDEDGQLARKGIVENSLLDQLNSLPFYVKPIPKSLGAEWVDEFIKPIISSILPIENALCTLVEHMAIQIANVLREYDLKNVLFTGGGVYNIYLMERIGVYSDTNIVVPKGKIVEYKEALIFAFLGLLRKKNKINVLSSVTGAKTDHSSGVIYQ